MGFLLNQRRDGAIRTAIMETVKKNTNLRAKEIAAIVGCSHFYVYEVLRESDQPISPFNSRLCRLEDKMRRMESMMIAFLKARRIDPESLNSD